MAADAKVWIVTGASRGIGAAIAAVAAESGHHVALIARGESGRVSLRGWVSQPQAGNAMSETVTRWLPPFSRSPTDTAVLMSWSTMPGCTGAESSPACG